MTEMAGFNGRELDGLRDMFQQTPAAMALLRGPTHVFELANPAYLELVDHRDLVGKTVAQALPEVVNQGFIQLLDEVWRTGEARVGRSIPMALQRGEPGTYAERVLDFVYQPIRSATGEVTGIFVQATDVTDRVRAEERLSQQRRLYEAILTNTPDLAYVFDLQHRFIYANEGLLRMWGKSWDEAIGHNCLELGYEPWHAAMHDREIEQVVATKQPIRGEVPFTGTFGRRIYDYVFMPVFNASGEVEAVAGTTRDVTDRKVSEEALRESQEMIALAMRGGRMGAWVRDIVSNQVQWSPDLEALFGLAPGAFGGSESAFRALVHPDDRAALEKSVSQAVDTHTDYSVEFRFKKGGTEGWQWMEGRGRAVYDASGNPVRLYGIGIDITERKRIESEIHSANRRKDEFLATLAHELRNPLAPIRNAVHLMKHVHAADPQLRPVRDIIERQVWHMVRLVDDLLDVSRITLGQVTLRTEVVSLGSVLTDAIEAARPLIEAGEHSFTLQLPSENLQVDGDATRLSQIFQNLLNNAAKYTPTGGRITLYTERDGNNAIVIVRDTGIGIPSELHSRIFELFTRAHPSEEMKTSGLGIGLALARQLVELHGGEITVSSAGSGAGSEFRVRLPLVENVGPAAAVIAEESAESIGTSTHRVLIVDDHKDAAESLAMLLQMHGCSVKTALSGPAALDLLAQFKPDIVLLDIGMPGMDGYTTARQIRSTAAGKETFLIALTGWGQESDKRLAREAGFDEHLTKPVDPSLLATLLAVGKATEKLKA